MVQVECPNWFMNLSTYEQDNLVQIIETSENPEYFLQDEFGLDEQQLDEFENWWQRKDEIELPVILCVQFFFQSFFGNILFFFLEILK